jgi:ankyrin repeat protein
LQYVLERRRTEGTDVTKGMLGFVGALALLAELTSCGARPSTPLARAAVEGRLGEMRELLADGAAVDATDPAGFSALLWAAREGPPEAVEALLEAGADPTRRAGGNGWTSLQHAVHRGRSEAVTALLATGRFAQADRDEALVMASGYGSPGMVRALLASGADPRARSKGAGALGNAVGGAWDIDARFQGCAAHTEVVKELLAAAPDLALRDDPVDRYALRYARARGCADLVALVEPSRGERK